MNTKPAKKPKSKAERIANRLMSFPSLVTLVGKNGSVLKVMPTKKQIIRIINEELKEHANGK